MIKTRREAKNEYSRNKFDFWDGVDTYNSILCSQKTERLSLSNSKVSSLNHRDDFNPAQWFDYTIREQLSQIRLHDGHEKTSDSRSDSFLRRFLDVSQKMKTRYLKVGRVS
jgi:hypothetical protein